MFRFVAERIRVVFGFILAGALSLSCLAIAGCTSDSHDPYTQDFSPVEKAQDFSLGGEDRYFDKLQPGKENVLMFWGSWCPHCESLIERVEQMEGADTVKENLFTVAEDEGLDDVAGHEGDFPIYLDQDESVYDMYQLEHIPSVFILDSEGNVLGSAQGEEDSFALLQEYVNNN